MKENKYIKRSRISEKKFRELLFAFSIDLTATQISLLTKINRNTINRILQKIRIRLAEVCEGATPFHGEVELDESYFGPRRQSGKRGRGAHKKIIVFGIYKRNGAVCTQIVHNCSKELLQKIVREKVSLNTIIHTDGWPAYDSLVDLGYQKHYRIKHRDGEFVRGNVHINGIEGFWGYVKTRLTKFKGLRKSQFYLHLKESEYRYNRRNENLYETMLTMFRNHPI